MKDIVKLFTDEKVTEISPLGKGHINGTFCVCLENSTGKKRRVVLQKINSYVFKDIDRLMKNICRVTDHLKTKLTPFENPDRAVMTVLPSLKGNSYEKINGEYYRCLSMIEDTITYDKIENCNDMYRCAAAFADFHKKLADFPAGTLRETIHDFQNTEAR